MKIRWKPIDKSAPKTLSPDMSGLMEKLELIQDGIHDQRPRPVNYRFEILRDANGLMTEVIARPEGLIG